MSPPSPVDLQPFAEVADGVFVVGAGSSPVNLGLVVGSESCLLVDVGRSAQLASSVRGQVRTVTAAPLAAVVLTHGHAGHAYGLGALADLTSIGHESLGKLRYPPSRTIAVATALDLGDRRVEIAHLGRGHTEGDLVIVVPEAGVVFAGDLLCSAGPPWYGEDSFPYEWPGTLDGLVGLMTDTTRAVPGHGPPVDREFVFEARGRVAAVAGEMRRLAELGVSAQTARSAGAWAYPFDHIAPGWEAGLAQLGPRGSTGRALPIL